MSAIVVLKLRERYRVRATAPRLPGRDMVSPTGPVVKNNLMFRPRLDGCCPMGREPSPLDLFPSSHYRLLRLVALGSIGRLFGRNSRKWHIGYRHIHFVIMGSNPLHHPDYAVFAVLLRSIREEAGVTQVELAGWLGIEQSTISKNERRERRVDVGELRRICIVLGVPLVEFISRLECLIAERGRMGSRDR